MQIDYREVGLKCGIEIHQMLDTRTKLFCSCPTSLRKDEADFEFVRWLRPTRSEMGEMDPAALFEYKKGVHYRYEVFEKNVCLVEMDEEPPHELNKEALELTLMFALMVNANPVDEIHVMRKIVIDGSNTTGFQRTALIALGGAVNVGGKIVPIQTICLEEDAARKVESREKAREVVYRLDRLGIPLIEIATAPVIETPREAEKVAYRIGQLLRALGRVKRGLGTIRQDLNISIKNGAKIEIKGVQELELIPKIVEYEVLRQLNLLKIKDELRKRGIRPEDIKEEFIDVTNILRETKSRIAQKTLRRGGVALALKLPGFTGLVGKEIQPGRRLGTEFADRARYWAEVGGIFHSDELPGYGISKKEVDEIRSCLKCREIDAFVLVFESEEKARQALHAVVERAREALNGVPEETRGANPDGTTRFLRPRPGKARMYPETDIRPVRVTRELLEKLRENLPELPEQKLEKFIKKYKLSEELAKKIIDSIYVYTFENIVENIDINPTLVASTLTNTLVNLRREGIPISALTESIFHDLFQKIAKGEVAKEAIPDILSYIALHKVRSVEDAIGKLGLGKLDINELEKIVDEILKENIEYIREKGERAFGKIMGILMSKVRGRVDGSIAAQLLKKKLASFS